MDIGVVLCVWVGVYFEALMSELLPVDAAFWLVLVCHMLIGCSQAFLPVLSP